MSTNFDKQKSYLTAKVAIDSFRDNGYSNTAYALAELIDNSIQAQATRVEIGFIEENLNNTKYSRKNVQQISVWDNGKGMNANTLELALEFGGSENRNEKRGMGKFGMGLPNSSISQCKKVEVWSWQNGNTPFYTYLDVEQMKNGELELIPRPVKKEIPEYIEKSHFKKNEKSGTLILWSNLDRLNWKTGASIFKHCEYLVGRIYRNFLDDNSAKVVIDSVIYNKNDVNGLKEINREHFKANDPLYLLKNTSLPKLSGNYKNEAFFELFADDKVIVKYFDEKLNDYLSSEVRIRSSVVKIDIAKNILNNSTCKLGSTEWGKHCARNIGVSIVRANRELVLKNILLNKELRQYKGRFIGLEIQFNPELDKIFGVTNNKQDAVNIIDYDFNELAIQSGFDSEIDYEKDLEDNNDPLLAIREVIKCAKNQLNGLASKLKLVPVDPSGMVNSDNPEEKASGIIPSDPTAPSIDEAELEDFFQNQEGDTPEDTKRKIETIKLKKYRYWIEKRARDSNAFFDVATKKGITMVTFNTNHRYYEQFISKLNENQLTLMEVAIASFAQVMNETTNDNRRDYLERVRRSWGEILDDWLTVSDENEF